MLVSLGRQFASAYGPYTFAGFARPSGATQTFGLIAAKTGDAFAIILVVEATAPHRIRALQFQPVPPSLPGLVANAAPFTGAFDIGGRRLVLSCLGSGSRTVVLEAGYGNSSTIWFGVQTSLAPFTRICRRLGHDLPRIGCNRSAAGRVNRVGRCR